MIGPFGCLLDAAGAYTCSSAAIDLRTEQFWKILRASRSFLISNQLDVLDEEIGVVVDIR